MSAAVPTAGEAVPTTVERIAGGLAEGVGYVVIGPMLGAALEAPALRSAVRGRVLEVGAVLGVSLALGVAVGMWLGRRGGGR